MKVLVAQSCLTLCDPLDCSLPGSFVHEILQARLLEWVAIPFSGRSSQPRNWTWISCTPTQKNPSYLVTEEDLTPSSQLYDHHIKALFLLRFRQMNHREITDLGSGSSLFDHCLRRGTEPQNFYLSIFFFFRGEVPQINQNKECSPRSTLICTCCNWWLKIWLLFNILKWRCRGTWVHAVP